MPQDSSQRRPSVLVLNRSYWPDAEATGQLLTELCEDLASRFDVTVIAGQPNQNPSGAEYKSHGSETHGGVTIRRVWHTKLPKSSLAGRIVNLATYFLMASWAALRTPRHDIVVVETDPPLLCWLGYLLKRVYGSQLVVYLQDIYPDLATQLGKLPDGWFSRQLRALIFGVYRRADRVVVLGQDMEEVLEDADVPSQRIACIPNWVDTQRIVPRQENNAFRQRHGLEGKFVVMYSGNMGMCQRLQTVVGAAVGLQHRPEIQLVLIGDGATRGKLERQAARLGLKNLRFLPYEPQDQLSESLSAADVQLVPLDPRVTSLLMPSKLYGILASASPVLAVVPKECELARIVLDARVGDVVAGDDPEKVGQAILSLLDRRAELPGMGERARKLAVEKYDRRIQTGRFAAMLNQLTPQGDPPPKPPSSPRGDASPVGAGR